jgi:hypothetical protein
MHRGGGLTQILFFSFCLRWKKRYKKNETKKESSGEKEKRRKRKDAIIRKIKRE